jgi:hypothetical protein
VDNRDSNDPGQIPVPTLLHSKSSHNNLNPSLRNKLKLDLSNVNNKNVPNVLSLNTKDTDSQEPLGFHDEFMARIEEFSLSWRQAALAEKKH